jgi:restriction endonuclease Mrr
VSDREVIYLDSVDGFEFERVCLRILERLNYGSVEDIASTRDRGRDLLAHTPEGTTVIECKHHPRGTIGRPVVQKLHSAILTSGNRRGMIMTTGRFSKAAIEYVNRLTEDDIDIQLVDRPILADMASRAGINLVLGNSPMAVWMYEVSSGERLEWMLSRFVDRLYRSRPEHASRILEILGREITLRPAYRVTYDIDAVFQTSVGVVHRETRQDGSFLLSGEEGGLLRSDLTEFLEHLPVRRYIGEMEVDGRLIVRPFRIDITSIKERAKQEIVKRHTHAVTYVGGNNRTYTKVCEPSQRQFTITDLRQIYVPVNRCPVRILRTTHVLDIVEHPAGGVRPLSNTLLTCRICSTAVDGRPYLCNICGSPAHPKQWLKSHSFECRQCRRIMCRMCARYVRRFLLRKVLCPLCLGSTLRYPPNRVRGYGPL